MIAEAHEQTMTLLRDIADGKAALPSAGAPESSPRESLARVGVGGGGDVPDRSFAVGSMDQL